MSFGLLVNYHGPLGPEPPAMCSFPPSIMHYVITQSLCPAAIAAFAPGSEFIIAKGCWFANAFDGQFQMVCLLLKSKSFYEGAKRCFLQLATVTFFFFFFPPPVNFHPSCSCQALSPVSSVELPGCHRADYEMCGWGGFLKVRNHWNNPDPCFKCPLCIADGVQSSRVIITKLLLKNVSLQTSHCFIIILHSNFWEPSLSGFYYINKPWLVSNTVHRLFPLQVKADVLK